MKEHVRVRLAVTFWSFCLVAVLVTGIWMLGREFGKEHVRLQPHHFDIVAENVLQKPGVDGFGVVCVQGDNIPVVCSYGSLYDNTPITLEGMADPILSIAVMWRVESGDITLDEAAAIVNSIALPEVYYIDAMKILGMNKTRLSSDCANGIETTLTDMSMMASALVGDNKLLSNYATKELLTSTFRWRGVNYESLLSAYTVEYCGGNAAIIIDRENDVALIVVVDTATSMDEDMFAEICSKCSSVVCAKVLTE